ncbi:Uncharacterized protein APZ42_009143, partial [Daphnia magna]
MNPTKKDEELTNVDWSDEILMTWIEEDTPQLETSETLPTGNDWEDELLANLMGNEAKGDIQICANASESMQVSRNINMEENVTRYRNSDSDCEFMQKKRYSNSESDGEFMQKKRYSNIESDCEFMQEKSSISPSETEEEETSSSKVGYYYSKIESDLDPSSSDS